MILFRMNIEKYKFLIIKNWSPFCKLIFLYVIFYFKWNNTLSWSWRSHQWWVRRKLSFSIILHWYRCRGLSTIARRFSRLHVIISDFISWRVSICLTHDINAIKETDQGHQGKRNHDNANTNRNSMIWLHFMIDWNLIG